MVHGQTPHFESHQFIKGERNYTTHAILQDHQGYIWFGTSKGLVRFDGINYQNFTVQEGLGDNHVTAMCEDNDGVLWIGHQNGSISLYKDDKISLFEPEEGLGTIPVTYLMCCTNNYIWFTTLGEGVYYFDRNRLYNLNTDDGLSDNYAYSLAEGLDSNLWICTDYGISIFNYTNKTFNHISMRDGLPDNIVKHIQKDDKDNMWIATDEEGLVYYDVERNKLTHYPDWEFGSINNFIVNNDELWISTKREGIVHLIVNGQQTFRYNLIRTDHGLLTDRTYCIYIDREKNIWIGTDQGVSQSITSVFQFLGIQHGLPFRMVYSLLVDENDLIWICSEVGLFLLTDSKSGGFNIKKVFENTDFNNAQFTSLYEDPLSYIWIGTYNYGVFRIDPATLQFKQFTVNDGLAGNDVISISGNDSIILLSTLGGGVTLCPVTHESYSFTNFTEEMGLGSNYIYSAMVDSKNRIWFAASHDRLTYYDQDEFHSFGEEDSLFFTSVYSFIEDGNKNIWFNTDNNGLYCFDGQRFTNYNESYELIDLDIFSISVDQYDNIVLVSNEGIDLFNYKDKYRIHFGENYGVSYTDPILNSIYQDKKGNIWIGNNQGVIKYNPTAYFADTIQPSIFISRKQIFNEPIPDDRNKFSHRQHHFTFQWAGLWYQDPDRLTYRYKLEGYDLDWLATNSNSVTYSRIPPGDYTFQIEVSLDNVHWIQPDHPEYVFTVRPPFWKTWWFILISILIILAGIYTVFRIRLANLKRAKVELEIKVREATEEILEKNEELEAQKNEIETQRDLVMEQRDKIAEQQQELQASIRYASRIQKAVLPPLKLVDNWLKEYFILNKPRDIVSGDFYWIAEKDNHLFVAVADSTGHGVPGAFMSMLGTSGYYEILNTNCDYDSGVFLVNLRDHIKKSLHHTGEEGDAYDGMDVSLCILNPDKTKVSFAGANNPVYLIRDGELTEYKGDKMPIGRHHRDQEPFTNNQIDVQSGDCFYLFSDGYADQFGGESGKKYKYQHFKDLLVKIHTEKMSRQKEILDEEIEKWKGDYEQIDDIMVLGFRI